MENFKKRIKNNSGNDFDLGIVYDTSQKKYKIINIDRMSLWDKYVFDNYDDAKNFIKSFPSVIN